MFNLIKQRCVTLFAEEDGSKSVESIKTSFLSHRAEQNGMGITRSLPETEPSGFRCLRPGLVCIYSPGVSEL